jgi:hypothetical protein
LVERFRQKIGEKGVLGMVGLRNRLRDYDENCSGALDYKEFEAAIKEFRIDVPDVDIKNAYKAFDLNRNG